jgi:hypothetical protein
MTWAIIMYLEVVDDDEDDDMKKCSKHCNCNFTQKEHYHIFQCIRYSPAYDKIKAILRHTAKNQTS